MGKTGFESSLDFLIKTEVPLFCLIKLWSLYYNCGEKVTRYKKIQGGNKKLY